MNYSQIDFNGKKGARTFMKTVWYISKYAGLPYVRVTSRAFFLMKALKKLGYNVTIFTSDSNHQTTPPNFSSKTYQHEIEGVPFIWLRTLKFIKSNSLKRIISWFHFEWRVLALSKSKLDKPDVVIASSLSLLTIFSGIYFKWYYGAKLIIEIRDIWPLSIVEEGNYSNASPAVRFLAWVERLGYRKADAIIGTMPNLGEHVDNVLGYCKEGVYCIPQGYDAAAEAHFAPLETGFVESYIPKDKFIVCYAGTVGLTNSLDKMIAAATHLEHSAPHIHFLIVGEGDDRNRLLDISSTMANVTIAPPITNTQVHDLLSSYADVVYFATTNSKIWAYGQSLNKLIDYMRSGKPVIASYNGYTSMVTDADCGSFIDPDDSEALADEIVRYDAMPCNDREKIGQRGAHWIQKNHNFDKLGEQLSKIIEDIT